MIKRILAWILLAGFILLLLNLFVFGWYTEVCVIIYVIIFVVYALFGLSKGRSLDFTKTFRAAADNTGAGNKEETEGEKDSED